jgi:hypothetical protein
MINSYHQALDLLHNRVHKKLANNTYARLEGNNVIVKLHDTDIITFTPRKAILNTDGWNTVTTKDRLNRFSPVFIIQHKSIWYIQQGENDWYSNYENKPIFYDGIEVKYNGEVFKKCLKYGDKRKKEVLKLKKLVSKYINAMQAHIAKNGIPLPDSGDCWDCCLKTESGQTMGEISNSNHLMLHLKEKYIHGSLIWNALLARGYDHPEYIIHMKITDSIVNAVRFYFYRNLKIC